MASSLVEADMMPWTAVLAKPRHSPGCHINKDFYQAALATSYTYDPHLGWRARNAPQLQCPGRMCLHRLPAQASAQASAQVAHQVTGPRHAGNAVSCPSLMQGAPPMC